MSDVFVQNFKDLVPKHLYEPWQNQDGLTESEIAESLSITIPRALWEFYLALGNSDLMEAYYYFWDPDELEVEDGYLLFMEDEEELYTWGIRADQVDIPDPLVWRRNNAKGNWVCEEGTFSEFTVDYFDWVFEEEDSQD